MLLLSDVRSAVSAPVVKVVSPVAEPAAQRAGKIQNNVSQGLDNAFQAFRLRTSTPDPKTSRMNILNTPNVRTNWDQLARQSDADQLKQADRLAQDAMGLVGGRTPSLAERVRAQVEMAEASQIRQSVANRLESQYPDPSGMGVGGGELLANEIRDADRDEHQAFQLLQSPNTADISAGASYLKAAMEKFGVIENDLAG